MLDIMTASATAYGTTARTWVGVISRRFGRTQRNITPAAITPRTQTAPSGPAATKAVVAIAVPNWTLVVDARTSAMGRQIPIGSGGAAGDVGGRQVPSSLPGRGILRQRAAAGRTF